MPVIDRSEEIDIDIGIPNEEEQSLKQESKEITPNPIFEDMEEGESEQESVIDPKAEEKAFYETLTDVEKEAWARGWRKGKYFKGKHKDGTPRPHKSAEEFLAVQEKETPVLNERNRKLTAEKTALEKEMAELRKQMNIMLNVQKIAYEEKTQNRFQSLEEAEEQAILEGDVAKVRAIQKQKLELEKSKGVFDEREIDEPKPNTINQTDKEVIDNWAADNSWFHQDRVMQAAAIAYFGDLSERIPVEERLEMVSEEIKARFGDKLGIPKVPKVESGIRGIQSTKKQYTYNDLPADVRKNCDFLARRHGFTKEQVAKMQQEAIREYFN